MHGRSTLTTFILGLALSSHLSGVQSLHSFSCPYFYSFWTFQGNLRSLCFLLPAFRAIYSRPQALQGSYYFSSKCPLRFFGACLFLLSLPNLPCGGCLFQIQFCHQFPHSFHASHRLFFGTFCSNHHC